MFLAITRGHVAMVSFRRLFTATRIVLTRGLVSKTGIPIVLIAHDLELRDDEMKREDPAKLANPIARSFEAFLEAFVSGSLDIDPLLSAF
jgi:hypothetical protein